jgi:hypothetical protein
MFNQQKADAVCARVAEGESLRDACAAEGTTHPTFLRWCGDDKALADQYARARGVSSDLEFLELGEIQREEPRLGPSGTVDAGWVAWKRLQIDTKKWELAKKEPKKYGDKIEHEHKGAFSVSLTATENSL